MSLSDRLASAARQREGVVDFETMLAPVKTTDREVSIILSAYIPVATVEPDPTAEPDSICPTCNRTGELGVIDLHRHTSDWSCMACGAMWRVTVPSSVPLRLY